MAAWLRRLITRAVAIVPASAVTVAYGSSGTAKLLILSQVILSLQLPFAVIPLVLFTADRSKLGVLVAPRWLTAAAALIALVIVILNAKLVVDFVIGA
jgi:manganese transport protein